MHKKILKLILAAFFALALLAGVSEAAEDAPAEVDAESAESRAAFDPDGFDEIDEWEDPFANAAEEKKPIADPLEPFNRAMFVFNDKMYFWVLKPVARGYGYVVPEPGRVAVKRFFSNLYTPVRLVNSVLQFKFKHAGTELSRFAINTTVGVLGFTDPARDKWDIYIHKEDFGQTLGFYGSGPGFYLVLPVLGPSSLRDGVGMVGDFFLDPLNYIYADKKLTRLSIEAYERVNSVSLLIGEYEDIKETAIDPYIFIRDAYHQHRESYIEE